MEKIAFLFENESQRSKYLIDILKDEYELIFIHSYEETISLLKGSFNDLSAFIVDNPSGKKYIKDIFKYVEDRNNYMFALPIILLSQNDLTEKDDVYLSDVVVGMITLGESKKTVLRRISNTIKFSNSASFDDFSKMLKALPSLIYLKDIDGRYAFSSQRWHHFFDPNKSIRGMNDFDIRKSKENAKIAIDADKKVINSGEGMRYVIKEEDDEGVDYLQVIKEPIKNDEGRVTGIIAIINNVTEEELLRQELRQKSITDQLTGVFNRVYFNELIGQYEKDLELPFTTILADCDGLKKINDKFGHAAGDKYICFAKDAIKESIPENASLFRMGGDEFVCLIPGMSKNEASIIMNKIIENTKKYKTKNFTLKLSVGSHTITKKGISIESAITLSDKNMYKMKKKKIRRICCVLNK